MSVLSVLSEDSSLEPSAVFVMCANPIVLTCEPQFRSGDEITFEVQEIDAASLKTRLGEHEQYAIDSGPIFWAQLTSLDPCQTTDRAFALVGKPMLRGVLTVRHVINQTATTLPS